jgi:hypothetical protein
MLRRQSEDTSMGTLAVIVLAVRGFLRHDLAAVDWMFGTSERRFKDPLLAYVHPPGTARSGQLRSKS